MIRLPSLPSKLVFRSVILLSAGLWLAPSFAPSSFGSSAQAAHRKKQKPAQDDDEEQPAKGKKDKKGKGEAKADGPEQVATFGEWGVFVVQAKAKTCYALAKPKTRAPGNLKRDDAYIFIATRPAERVRNEVSITMGYPMKDQSEPKADIGGATYDLVAKGANAWVKNTAQEGAFIDAMRKASKLVVKASSARGKSSTDTYALSGLSEALARVQKECP